MSPTTFKDLLIGDLYNTKAHRSAKIAENKAVVVLSAILAPGTVIEEPPDTPVVVLYSGKTAATVDQATQTVKGHLQFKVDAYVRPNQPDRP
jgi:hypothetical protein